MPSTVKKANARDVPSTEEPHGWVHRWPCSCSVWRRVPLRHPVYFMTFEAAVFNTARHSQSVQTAGGVCTSHTTSTPNTFEKKGLFMEKCGALPRECHRPPLFSRLPVNGVFVLSSPLSPPRRRGSKLCSPSMMTRSRSSCSRASAECGSTSASPRLRRELG